MMKDIAAMREDMEKEPTRNLPEWKEPTALTDELETLGFSPQEAQALLRYKKANPAHGRLIQRTPEVLLHEYFSDFQIVDSPYDNDGELDSLEPIGYLNAPPHGALTVVYDDGLQQYYAFSAVIPAVVFQPLYVLLPSPEEEEWYRDWIALIVPIVCSVLVSMLIVNCLSRVLERFIFTTTPPQNNTTKETPEDAETKAPSEETESLAISESSQTSAQEEEPAPSSSSQTESIPLAQAEPLQLEPGTAAIFFASLPIVGWLFHNSQSTATIEEEEEEESDSTTQQQQSNASTADTITNTLAQQRFNRREGFRRKGSRRLNRQNQVLSTGVDALAIPSDSTHSIIPEETEAVYQEFYSHSGGEKALLVMGDQLQDVRVSLNSQETTDACPACLDSFQKELACTMCAILPCQHSFCLPCLVGLEETIDTGRADPSDAVAQKRKRECPSCRHPTGRLLQTTVNEIKEMPTLKNRLELLEGISLQDKDAIVKSLLKANQFVIYKVEKALEDMLIGSLSVPAETEFKSSHHRRDLTAEEKEKIYAETQRPVLTLRKQLKHARWAVLTLKRRKTKGEALSKAQESVQELEEQLFHAIQNCREDTYNQINSRGTMGTEQASKGTIVQVDYHSLHARDAIQKFEELVLPFLPVLKRVAIITGRGKRSANGMSTIQSALKTFIEDHHNEEVKSHLKWEPVAGNEGVIVATWQD